MVWSVVSYGVEIWGWKERESLEKLQERFLKWILGVERSTPGYMVRKELQREKLKGRSEGLELRKEVRGGKRKNIGKGMLEGDERKSKERSSPKGVGGGEERMRGFFGGKRLEG